MKISVSLAETVKENYFSDKVDSPKRQYQSAESDRVISTLKKLPDNTAYINNDDN